MDDPHQHHSHDQPDRRANWALLGFIAVIGFFLFTEHRAHLFGILPFLLLLACPLMHLFHHGHGGGHDHGEQSKEDRP